MHRQVTAVLTLSACLCAGQISAAGDWPQFRGPTGQGIAEINADALPLTWSESDNVRWKVPVAGLGWSSPIVVDGRVYLTTAVAGEDESTQTLAALCLDATTGSELWRNPLFEQSGEVEIHKKNSHASPSPVIEDGRAYVHFGPHGTACLTSDGELVWKNEELKYGPRHGTGSSPAIAGDLLIIPCDGWDTQFVVGLEKATGTIRWKVARNADASKGFSFSTPLIIDVEGKPQAVCPGSSAVVAYDPATGAEIWRARYGDGYSVVPRPVYAGGLVYVCTGYWRPLLLAIDPTGSGDVTDTHIKWQTDEAAPNNPSVLVIGERLYMVSDGGVATCLNAQTGKQLGRKRLGGNYSASPLYVDGRIYFQDENGTAIVMQEGPEFEELARNKWGDEGRTFASYAVADGALFLRSETHVYRIEHGP